MARYIDADKLALKWILASPKQKETFRQIIDEEPSADVVPKSEVERLRGQVNRLKKYDEERDVALHARLINETKADTVRKMQESLKECFDSESDFPTQTHGYIRYTVDQIAKEILEGNNNGN